MLRRLLTPVHSIDLESLRRAGRFRSPEGEGDKGAGGDGKAGDKPAGDNKSAGDGGKPDEGDKGKGGGDFSTRINTLVDERNAAQRLADEQKAAADQLRRELDQLKANDQTKVVSDLQKQLSDVQAATKTRFDKLLEAELANLPDTAAAAVKAIPGGSEVQFDWLIANRSLFKGTGEDSKGGEKKGVDGPTNDKKPPKSDDAGASSVAKSYVESRKPQKSGFPGLTG